MPCSWNITEVDFKNTLGWHPCAKLEQYEAAFYVGNILPIQKRKKHRDMSWKYHRCSQEWWRKSHWKNGDCEFTKWTGSPLWSHPACPLSIDQRHSCVSWGGQCVYRENYSLQSTLTESLPDVCVLDQQQEKHRYKQSYTNYSIIHDGEPWKQSCWGYCYAEKGVV